MGCVRGVIPLRSAATWRPGAAPLYSLRLAPPPKTPGGGGLRSRYGRRLRGGQARRPFTPLGSHLPQKPLGEVDFDPASDRCVAPPSPAQFAGEGRGGGRLTIFLNIVRSPPLPALPQPPPAVSGEVGRWCRPGGGLHGRVRSTQNSTPPQRLPSFTSASPGQRSSGGQ